MKKFEDVELRMERVLNLFPAKSSKSSTRLGIFEFPLENGESTLLCSAVIRDYWEHVFLDLRKSDRCPTYEEMCRLKQYFFNENEIALQIHPKKSEYVNACQHRLHLWRKVTMTALQEELLRRKITKVYDEARKLFSGERKEIFLAEYKVLVIFCGDDWLTWEEICKIKQQYWEPEEVAVQFNISPEFDLNSEHMILLWDGADMVLPPKNIV